MPKSKIILNLLILLLCSLVLAGCNRRKKDADKAIAEAEHLKAKLEILNATLERTISEKQDITKELEVVLEELEQTKLKAVAALKLCQDLQSRITALTTERDSAIAAAGDAKAMSTKLNQQLTEEAEEVLELDESADELQIDVNDINDQTTEVFDVNEV